MHAADTTREKKKVSAGSGSCHAAYGVPAFFCQDYPGRGYRQRTVYPGTDYRSSLPGFYEPECAALLLE